MSLVEAICGMIFKVVAIFGTASLADLFTVARDIALDHWGHNPGVCLQGRRLLWPILYQE